MTSPSSINRYEKQERFAPCGSDGQAALNDARVLLCGCGATGSVLAELLTRAGVGHLRIVDRDFVEWSNLQRQLLFNEQDAAERTPKAIAAAERLRTINSEMTIEPVIADLGPDNILDLARDCRLILDGTDNFETRFLINDAALEVNLPWVYTGVLGAAGQSLPILPGRGGCFRCLMETPPPAGTSETCDSAGVLGPAVASVAGFSAATALKLLIAGVEAVEPRLTIFDVWNGTVRSIGTEALRRGPGCPACGEGRRDWLAGARSSRAALLCGRNAVQITPPGRERIDLAALAARLEAAGPTTLTRYLLRHTISESACEITIFPDGRAIIQGTEEIAAARALYARIVGA